MQVIGSSFSVKNPRILLGKIFSMALIRRFEGREWCSMFEKLARL